MSLLALIKGRRGASGFGFASTAEEVTAGIDLSGKTVLITGINSGIGKESGRVLSSRGAHVIGAARTLEKAQAACAEFSGETTPVACELSDPASVRACVEQLKELGRPLDVLMANAGVMAIPERQQAHGLELQFFTNHVGHFILVTGLLDSLAPEGRVVMLSSGAHRFTYGEGIRFDDLAAEDGYSAWRAYGQSKVSNLLFAKELARRLAGTGKTANSVHPGGIKTNLGRHINKVAWALAAPAGLLFMKSIPQGAATQCYVATHPDLGEVSGEYFEDNNVATPSAHGRDAALARRLWDVSEKIVARLD